MLSLTKVALSNQVCKLKVNRLVTCLSSKPGYNPVRFVSQLTLCSLFVLFATAAADDDAADRPNVVLIMADDK